MDSENVEKEVDETNVGGSKVDENVNDCEQSGSNGDDFVASKESRGTLEYMWQTGKVLREKAWSALWKFDMFQKVDRIYAQESYYDGMIGITHRPASRVVDNIWIGSAFNAADYKWLKNNEIELIVNITSDISNYYPNEFSYVNYETEDLESGGVSDFLDDFVQLVRLNPDRRILVHCFAGKSRSASLVLYYLIREKEMTFDSALEYLKVRRPSVNINCRFLEEIKEKIRVIM